MGENDNTNKKVDTKTTYKYILNDEFIRDISNDAAIIKYMRKEFNRLSRSSCKILIEMLLTKKREIKCIDLRAPKSFFEHNTKNFNENGFIKPDIIINLNNKLFKKIDKLYGKIKAVDFEELTEKKKQELMKQKVIIDNEDYYVLTKDVSYKKMRDLICIEGGDAKFFYDFDEPDIPLSFLKVDNMLQRSNIQVLSVGVPFNHPIKYIYRCPYCNTKTYKFFHEVICTNNKFQCPGMVEVTKADGTLGLKVCNKLLSPDDKSGDSAKAFFYYINHETENGLKETSPAISFLEMEPGYYESSLFHLNNNGSISQYQIMTIKPSQSGVLHLPVKTNGNYIFDLIECFDKFIEKNSKTQVCGMLPVKAAFIMQAICSYLRFPLYMHIGLVGDPSTGKSFLSKYYGYLLYGGYNLDTSGLSVSVPGLRGTRVTIDLFGKDIKTISVGHLGTFKCICIDEAGENAELVQNLKTYLYKDNYDYSKAGGFGVQQKRTAHINISENVDNIHQAQYRGSIRKAYKELNIEIKDVVKEDWEENWDLHLPLYMYKDNSYLMKVVKDKRDAYFNSGVWWVDGRDVALHDRFPFYFYLVNKKDNPLLDEALISNSSEEDSISEGVELMKALKNDTIVEYFESLKEFIKGDDEIEGLRKIRNILIEYGVNVSNSRTVTFYHLVAKVSRILNKRKEFNDEDYDLVKWFIENTNRKMDVADIIKYKLEGPPNIKEIKEQERLIEESVVGGDFGLPDGEF